MILPQAGDLVRLFNLASGVPYEKLLGIVLGYETKGTMAGRSQVVWFGTGSGASEGQTLCYSPNRLQVVNETR